MRQKITTVLQNGARIVAELKHRDYHLVLCESHLHDGEFVTWSIGPTERKDEKMPAYLGSYFEDEKEARINFIERCANALGVAS